MIYFGDKEFPKLHSISFEQIEPDCQSLIVWQLSRTHNDWQLTAPMIDLKLTKLSGKSLKKLTETVISQTQAAQAQRW